MHCMKLVMSMIKLNLHNFFDDWICCINYYSLNEGKRQLELDRVAEENKVRVLLVTKLHGHSCIAHNSKMSIYYRLCSIDCRQLNPCIVSLSG